MSLQSRLREMLFVFILEETNLDKETKYYWKVDPGQWAGQSVDTTHSISCLCLPNILNLISVLAGWLYSIFVLVGLVKFVCPMW